MLQGCKRELMFVLIAGDRQVNFGRPFVVRQPDVGNSDRTQSRVLKLVSNNLGDLFANRVRYSFRAMHLQLAETTNPAPAPAYCSCLLLLIIALTTTPSLPLAQRRTLRSDPQP